METDTFQNSFTAKILTDAIKAGSALGSIAAILYLYGFGLSAKVNILAYVSLTDYIRVAVGWIVPALGLTSLAGFLTPQFIAAVQHSKKTERESVCVQCEYERRTNRLLELALGCLDLTVLLWVWLALRDADLKQIILVVTTVVLCLWTIVIIWMYKSADNAIRLGHEKFGLISICPILLIFSLGLGLSDGMIAGKKSMSSRDNALITSASGPQIYGELLFSFDKFVVIREGGHTELTFLPSDKIKSIKIPVKLPISTQGPQSSTK